MSGDSEAATIYGNAIAPTNASRDSWRVDLELRAFIRGTYPKNKTDILNEPGEHIFVDGRLTEDQETLPPMIS